MAKFGKFMFGFILGLVVGGGASILYAPHSGNQLRAEINQNIKKASEDIRLAAIQRREELEIQLEQLRSPKKPEEQ